MTTRTCSRSDAVVVPGARDEVDEAVLRLCRAVVAVTIRAGNAADPPLSPTQLRALTVLADEEDGQSLTAVADRLAATLPSASRLLARLTRDGLVDRDAGPGNEVRLRLSPAGRRRLAALNASRAGALRAAVDALPARQKAAVLAAFDAVADAAREGGAW